MFFIWDSHPWHATNPISHVFSTEQLERVMPKKQGRLKVNAVCIQSTWTP